MVVVSIWWPLSDVYGEFYCTNKKPFQIFPQIKLSALIFNPLSIFSE
jgi:hypothetical protein